MIVYKITNKINDKFYIGKDSKNNKNYFGSGLLIKKAIKKYGKENFTKDIIEHCDSIEMLNEREEYWVEYYKNNFRHQCYNIGAGGVGGDNFTDNPNREAILETMKRNTPKGENHVFFGKKSPSSGKKWKQASKDKLRESLLKSEKFQKAVHSKERAVKISESQNGVPCPNRAKFGHENHMFGKHHSEESKNKTSNSIKNSEVYKKAIASPERSRKLSEKLKGRTVSEERKKKTTGEKNGMYNKTHTTENKKKMSFPMELNPRARVVFLLSSNNEVVNSFGCITEAADFLNRKRQLVGVYAKNNKEIKPGLFVSFDNTLK